MILTIHVKPRARKNTIDTWLDDTTLKVSVTAAPENGKANEAVLDLLADAFHVSSSSLKLVRGFTTRMKQVEIPDSLLSRAKILANNS